MEIFKKILLVACLLIPTLLLAEVVNINTADKESLMSAITGVGEKRAEAIIAYREQNGPFKSIEELVEVRGVSASIVEANMDNLSLEDQ
ncbi:MAG: helix-hairpin-helix domain-containing protein [Proteobacteria bacterium]|nr:helix-hairpin-helix domain-containing protein [Pseudomonadota bacterium]